MIIDIMAEKRDSDLLEFCPNEFNLEHSGLSSLFCYAAVGLDNHLLKRISDNEYLTVIRAGKILYQYAEKTKAKVKENQEYWDPFSDIFFFRFLQELGEKPKTVEEIADSIMQLGLDVIKMRELPQSRQIELRDICLKLSERTRSHWQEYHPDGFRRYAA
jgi:hypothetical protein